MHGCLMFWEEVGKNLDWWKDFTNAWGPRMLVAKHPWLLWSEMWSECCSRITMLLQPKLISLGCKSLTSSSTIRRYSHENGSYYNVMSTHRSTLPMYRPVTLAADNTWESLISISTVNVLQLALCSCPGTVPGHARDMPGTCQVY